MMKKRSSKIALFIIAAIGVLLLGSELTNTTYIFHKAPTSAATKEKLEGSTTSQQSQAKGSENNTTGKPTKNTGGSTGFVLQEPSGNFVSNHHAYLTSKEHFNIEQSVCTTTSGATCQITFTNVDSGAKKSLEPRTADAGGSAYWTWELQDIGLTIGNWRITAVAKHGSDSKIAQDPMLLEIRQ